MREIALIATTITDVSSDSGIYLNGMRTIALLLEAAFMRTIPIVSLLLATSACNAQWTKSEYRDELHNKTGVKFILPAKEEGGGIAVRCSDGKLEEAWLMTNKIAEARDGGRWNNTVVDIEYRSDDEPKPHQITLPVSSNFQGVLLQSPDRVGLGPKSVFWFRATPLRRRRFWWRRVEKE